MLLKMHTPIHAHGKTAVVLTDAGAFKFQVGEAVEVPEAAAYGILSKHPSKFEQVEKVEKAVKKKSDKMVASAPENKSIPPTEVNI